MFGMYGKIIAAPLIVWLGTAFGLVHYASWAQIIGVGLVIALGDMLVDATLLPRVGNMSTTGLDWALATLIIWLSGFVFARAATPFLGALITGLILAASEWMMHANILANRHEGRREAP